MQDPILVTTMKEKAEAVQSVVSEISSPDAAFSYAVELTKQQGGSTIAAPGLKSEETDQLKKLCDENGITLITSSIRKEMQSIHTALTHADYGVAETGTLVVHSASEDLRIATMLSETHIAILPKQKIHASMDDLEDVIDQALKSDTNYLAFITGPSRTADIERVLSIGVHGPQELHILLTEENAS